MVAHISVASSKHKVELDSNAETHVVGDNWLVIYELNRPVNIYCYDPKNNCRSDKTVDAVVAYQVPQSGQKYILMIGQAIHINGLENHLLCLMQFHLNGVHISEVARFLAESLSVTTHAIQLEDLFNAAHPLMTQLSSVNSYFDV